MTLPILAKTFTAKIEAASAIIGYLYGVNTLGAAVGALVTPWILLRQFRLRRHLANRRRLERDLRDRRAGPLVVGRAGERSSLPPQNQKPPKLATAEASRFPVRVWMLIYALSGFIALALEIVWFRLLGVLQKSTAFTFPTLLAVYLGGLAVGVMIGVPLARRVRRPAVTFLALQSGITIYAGAAFALLLHHVNRRAFLQTALGLSGRLRTGERRGHVFCHPSLAFGQRDHAGVRGKHAIRPPPLFRVAVRPHRSRDAPHGHQLSGFAKTGSGQPDAAGPPGWLAANTEHRGLHAGGHDRGLGPAWLAREFRARSGCWCFWAASFLCLAVWQHRAAAMEPLGGRLLSR